MNGKDIISLSFRNLLRRKTRTILAIVGVVIGISAIIVMLSIGFGLQQGYAESVAQWGNLHMVTVYKSGGGYYSGGGYSVSMYSRSGSGNKEEVKLDDKAIAAMEKIPYATAVSPYENAYLTFVIGKYRASSNIIGIKPEMMEKFNYDLGEGRLLQPGDKEDVVFGSMVPSQFYNPKKTWGSSWGQDATAQVDVIDDKIQASAAWDFGMPENQRDQSENRTVYKEYKFKGVGVLQNTEDYETAYNVYMPIDTVRKISEETAKAEKRQYDKNSGYSQAMVYVEDITRVRGVSDAIREMGFQTSSMSDALEAMEGQARMVQAILGSLGAISLLVAALGITNTMIMSIFERTKEIGIMKVIGANLPDIGMLFLTEAALIGFAGGMAGVGLSYLLALLLNTVLSPLIQAMIGGATSTVSVIPLWLPLLALGFATFIGIVSGLLPALRAMRMSALESIRNE